MIKSNYKVIAVMSGTSLDGIDIIYATYKYNKQWSFEINEAATEPYPKRWKLLLRGLSNKKMDYLQNFDEDYSAFLAEKIRIFIEIYKIEDIDFIASHGHTALHQPENQLTYQIGNRQILADLLKTKVICDFRVQDVELGGQGAPLVPIGDRLLFSDYKYCLNLGGFANISFEKDAQRIAYDICPVNIVLNHYVSKIDLEYDDKGKLALTGHVHSELLTRLNALQFYKEKPPKSVGIEWVETFVFPIINDFNLQIEDILKTFVEHVAIQISKHINEKNTQVLVTGGGAYNDFLMSRISVYSESKIVIPESQILEFKEALIFGLLGVLKERNEINCLKSVTGAEKNHSSGKILMPKNQD